MKEKIFDTFESGKNPKKLRMKTVESDSLDKFLCNYFLYAGYKFMPTLGMVGSSSLRLLELPSKPR